MVGHRDCDIICEDVAIWSPNQAFWACVCSGDVRSHRDVWNSKPSAFVKSHTVMIWLQEGNSQLILESTDQQHVVDAIAGRLVAFNNRCFRHEVHGSSEVRAMLGPMALDATGKFAAVMDPIDFTSSNRGCWANCLCCCFLCCAGSCFLLVNTIGRGNGWLNDAKWYQLITNIIKRTLYLISEHIRTLCQYRIILHSTVFLWFPLDPQTWSDHVGSICG